MPVRKINAAAAAIDFAQIRAELDLPEEYPQAAVDEAVQVAQTEPTQTEPTARRDATDIPFVTLDPEGSKDLDQAVHLAAGESGGFVVHYAIADVAACVAPGGAIDAESRRRGQTYYCPDRNVPLHPVELSEGSASLLPDQTRAAVLWTIALDGQGTPTEVTLERALVRSVAQLDYVGAQADADAGRLHPSIALLPDIGERRLAAARERHAISLDLPDTEVTRSPDGHWTLELRSVLDVEKWNAEISLLTGMCAAKIMLDGGIGLLRTLPEPDDRAIAKLRKETAALGIDWPADAHPGDITAGLDGSDPAAAAFLADAVKLLRGAGYTAFTGKALKDVSHAGVGAPYAHVTAPLRRLADRFATEVCLALTSGQPVPDWASGSLEEVAETMESTDRTAHTVERECIGMVTAFLLADRVGDTFAGVVVQIDDERDLATIAIAEPPVQAKCPSDGLTEGTEVRVELVSVDERHYEVRPVAS